MFHLAEIVQFFAINHDSGCRSSSHHRHCECRYAGYVETPKIVPMHQSKYEPDHWWHLACFVFGFPFNMSAQRLYTPNCLIFYFISSYLWLLYRCTLQWERAQHVGFCRRLSIQHHSLPILSDHSMIAAAVLCEYIQPHDILYISRGRMHVQGPQSLPHSIPCAAVKCEKARRCLGSWSDKICKASPG